MSDHSELIAELLSHVVSLRDHDDDCDTEMINAWETAADVMERAADALTQLGDRPSTTTLLVATIIEFKHEIDEQDKAIKSALKFINMGLTEVAQYVLIGKKSATNK